MQGCRWVLNVVLERRSHPRPAGQLAAVALLMLAKITTNSPVRIPPPKINRSARSKQTTRNDSRHIITSFGELKKNALKLPHLAAMNKMSQL